MQICVVLFESVRDVLAMVGACPLLVDIRCRNLSVPVFYMFYGPLWFACCRACVLCSFGWLRFLASRVQRPGLGFYGFKMFYHMWDTFWNSAGPMEILDD